MDLTAQIRAVVLSKFVTRVIKAPKLDLTTRPVGKPEELMVPTRHGEIRCFVTRPASDAPLSANAVAPPVHINIHGGAFLIGNPRQDDQIVRAVAGDVGAVVVNIDYTTSPRQRFPRAHEECFDVFEWVRREGSRMGWDTERMSIGGGSAGANLSLGVIELLRRAGKPTVRTAVLTVPLVDSTVPPEYFASLPGKHFVSEALIRTINVSYFADASSRSDTLASPLLLDAEELAALPPLLVLAAENDSLRSQAESFVVKAHAAGADVTQQIVPGVDHDFPVMASTANDTAQRDAGKSIVEHLLHWLA